jgi:hypothetical protein
LPVRDELIARKGEVQARIRSLRPRVDAAAERAAAARGIRRGFESAQLASLQAELESLMAEEARLRVEIDRAPR